MMTVKNVLAKMIDITRQNIKDILGLAILLIVSGFLILYRLGAKPLIFFDEGIYADITKNMISRGDLLNQFFAGSLWFEKPPLYMWSSKGLSSLFGYNTVSVRLTSALAGISLIVLTYFIAKDIFNRRAGFVAALAVLLTPAIIFRSRQGSLDVLLTFFVYLGLWASLLARRSKTSWHGVGIAFAGAFMTKGAASLLLPITILIWLITDKKILQTTLRNKHFFYSSILYC